MKKDLDLEILISTMNRKDLSFLDKMFPELNLSLYSLLIINQTHLKKDLTSSNPKVRVINSREFGLSKSRNLAIENAKGDILLIADDDIEYLPDFEKTIFKAYQTYPDASLISFQYINEYKKFGKLYPNKEGYIKSTKRPLSSVEISFKREDIIFHDIRMNEYFGLGTTLPSSEEQLFKYEILKKGLKVAYVSQPILKHKGKTKASSLGAPELIRATSAQKYLIYKNWVYVWLIKYVFFLYRHGYISFLSQQKAYSIGLDGVSEIKNTLNEN